MRWIIDTDAGVDDAIAIGIACAAARRDPSALLALTTVAGNVSLDKVNVNVGAVLDIMGASVPFYAGCAVPLFAEPQRAEDFHGADGLGDAGLSHTSRLPEREHAAVALAQLAERHAGEVGIIAIGPLTNLALACHLSPSLPQQVHRLVVMGGAWQAFGNQTPAAEFNIAADPEAARVVFERFEDIVLLPWETSLAHMMSFEDLEHIASMDTPRAQFFAAMTRIAHVWRARFGLQGVPLPDPLAVAVALDADVIADSFPARVLVDLSGDVARGLTALDRRTAHPNALVVTSVNAALAWQMIAQAWC